MTLKRYNMPFFFIGAVILSALTLTGYLLFEERSRILDDADRRLESITTTISRQFSEVNAEIVATRNALQPELTRLELLGYKEFATIEKRLSEAATLDPRLIELVLLDHNGKFIASSSGARSNETDLEVWANAVELEPRFLKPEHLSRISQMVLRFPDGGGQI